jgi:hypothetical protein
MRMDVKRDRVKRREMGACREKRDGGLFNGGEERIMKVVVGSRNKIRLVGVLC